jgi:hypothetical protein
MDTFDQVTNHTEFNLALPNPLLDIHVHDLPDGSRIRKITILEPKLYLPFGRTSPFISPPWCLAQTINLVSTEDPTSRRMLNGAVLDIWRAMRADLDDLSNCNTLSLEFRFGTYSMTGITICYTVLSLSTGNPVHIVEYGTVRVVKLQAFREIVNVGLVILQFDDGSIKELHKNRLPFTNEAGLWISARKGNWILPPDWFPLPPPELGQQIMHPSQEVGGVGGGVDRA